MSQIQHATHEGVIVLANGDIEIPCAVLKNGTRLLTSKAVLTALGRPWKGSYKRTELPNFVDAKNLKPIINKELTSVLSPVFFIGLKRRKVIGYRAELLPSVCDLYLDARDQGILTPLQLPIAQRAEVLMRGLAHIGILALVDEATGYQEIRDREALQQILDTYLQAHQAKWAKRFPDAFYKEIFRLRDWQWQGMKVNRPQVVGHYTNDIVWNRLAPGVNNELKKLNPKDPSGKRRARHHQWLTDNVGHPALQNHLIGVMAIMRSANSWDDFQRALQRAYPKVNSNLELPLDV